MRHSAQETIQKLINERYSEALAVFWAGSVSRREGTQFSDLDLVIIYEKLPNAYREAFIYEDWPIDAFVHDRESIRYFFEESRKNSGISGTIQMILSGKEMMPSSDFSNGIRKEAYHYLKQGPAAWDKSQIDKERFLMTDALEDILYPKSYEEQIASASWLFEALSQFYFRAQNKWCASGKSIIHYLHQANPDLAREFSESFKHVFKGGDAAHLKRLVEKILQPYGGFLWEGYYSDASQDAKMPEPITLAENNDYMICLGEHTHSEITAILPDRQKDKEQMKKLDTYQNLCTEVYDLSKPNAPQNEYEFYRSYVIEAKGAILEPMCGTGRFLLPLIEEGFDVHGFDASQSMLQKLYAKARAKNLKPNVWYDFIENLNQSDRYQLIFIPTGSFGLITEKKNIQKALKTIYAHLGDKGLFVFETETLHAVPKELGIWRGSRWPKEDGTLLLLSQLAILNEEVCYSIGKYELIDNNSVLQTEVEEYKIRIYQDPSFLLHLLAEVGFSEVRLIKAFNRQASPDETDASIVFECRK
ncbi:methyltransferase [Legionella santicrucis]|uniref:Methyltransferase n=2 Tax=Legionella santicrucis TaxID=45074 RepID=A0A0W0ZF72_9GAMM|nr:methyltransferase [Legionella santicrucis]